VQARRRFPCFFLFGIYLAVLLFALSSCGRGNAGQSDPMGTGDSSDPGSVEYINVNLASTSKASSGGTVEIPLSIDHTESVAGLDITVTFDSSVLTFQGLSEGEAAQGFLFEQSPSAGSVRVVSAGTQSLAAGGGSVVILRFAVNTVPSGTLTNLSFSSVALFSPSAERLSNITFHGGTVIVE